MTDAPSFFGMDSPFVALCRLDGFEAGEEGTRVRVDLRPELLNTMGGAHGGLIATIFDSAMVAAARFHLDPEGAAPVSTVDLSLSYIAPARKSIVCNARVTAKAGRNLFAEAIAVNEDGAVMARGTATLREMKRA